MEICGRQSSGFWDAVVNKYYKSKYFNSLGQMLKCRPGQGLLRAVSQGSNAGAASPKEYVIGNNRSGRKHK